VRDLEKCIEEALASADDAFSEGLNDELTALTEGLSGLEDSPEPQDTLELFDPDAEERLQQLQHRLDELEQLHEDVLRQRDERQSESDGDAGEAGCQT
jgi:hypothetical protein